MVLGKHGAELLSDWDRLGFYTGESSIQSSLCRRPQGLTCTHLFSIAGVDFSPSRHSELFFLLLDWTKASSSAVKHEGSICFCYETAGSITKGEHARCLRAASGPPTGGLRAASTLLAGHQHHVSVCRREVRWWERSARLPAPRNQLGSLCHHLTGCSGSLHFEHLYTEIKFYTSFSFRCLTFSSVWRSHDAAEGASWLESLSPQRF